MIDIIKALKDSPDYIGSSGRSEEEISNAEKVLGISFAKDYRRYLSEIGLACYDGHELTGITDTIHVDIVSVTTEKRNLFRDVDSKWYVIEDAFIDGIVIWQSPDGTIYETRPNSTPKKIANSLVEYISK